MLINAEGFIFGFYFLTLKKKHFALRWESDNKKGLGAENL